MKTRNKKYLFDLGSFIRTAIKEDAPWGDITSIALVPKIAKGTGRIISRGEYVVSGIDVAKMIYREVDPKIKFKKFFKDGAIIKKGEILFEVKGSVRSMLLCERLTLNIVSHMMGIATATKKLCNIVKGTKTKVLDTRKTMPGMRVLQKMAVKDGGGQNHRFCLSDAVLAKENHIAIAGGVEKALKKLSKVFSRRPIIEIEVRSLGEFNKVLANPFKPDIVMLDNMQIADIKRAVKLNNGRVKLEVSGGVNEANILAYARTGVDFISVGALTHSVKAADISFLLTTVA